MRKFGEKTPVGEILSETTTFTHQFFPVVERVIQTQNGDIRKPQLIWDRSGKSFTIAVVTDENGLLVLVREAKYGQMRFMVSAPTGGVKKSETPIDTASREFFEETGYKAESWTMLGEDQIVDFGDKINGGGHSLCIVRNAHQVTLPRDPDQSVVLVTPKEFFALALSGQMPAMSIAAIALALHYCIH